MEQHGTPNEAKPRIRICQPLHAVQVADALLKIQTVCAITGLSASTVRRKIAEDDFPAPIKMGQRCTRWRAELVTNWLREKGGAA